MDRMVIAKGKRHRWLWTGLAVGLALGFGLVITQSKSRDGASGEGDPSETVQVRREQESARNVAAGIAGEGRPSRGPSDAAVIVVEFTDYQCPFCTRHFQQTYPLLLQEYGDRIKYVVRNFPIVQAHPKAAKAAEAAQCAFDQGKFWDYHDRLFENNSALDLGSLKRHAEDLGLDTSRFNNCLESGSKTRIVAQDLEAGRRYGVRGTPTFFINGRILIGAQPFEVFREYIERALQEARAE